MEDVRVWTFLFPGNPKAYQTIPDTQTVLPKLDYLYCVVCQSGFGPAVLSPPCVNTMSLVILKKSPLIVVHMDCMQSCAQCDVVSTTPQPSDYACEACCMGPCMRCGL